MTIAKSTMSRGKPVGSVAFGPSSGLGPNWLPLLGQTVSRTTYKQLFDLMGTTYNTGGESVSDFRLPLTQGYVIVGPDNYGSGAAGRNTGYSTLYQRAGSSTHTLTVSQTPNHTHTTGETSHGHGVSAPSHQHSAAGHARLSGTSVIYKSGSTVRALGLYSVAFADAASVFNTFYGSYAGYSISASGSGSAHENEQPNIWTHMYVKAA